MTSRSSRVWQVEESSRGSGNTVHQLGPDEVMHVVGKAKPHGSRRPPAQELRQEQLPVLGFPDHAKDSLASFNKVLDESPSSRHSQPPAPSIADSEDSSVHQMPGGSQER